MRVRIDLSYDGSGFSGWATQPGLRTVQGTLEAALATVLRVPSVSVTCAGRTDAGVHARGQVCHLDLDPEQGEPDERLLRRVNGVLPADVRVRRIASAPAGFDARYAAVWRRYSYRVADRPDVVDPLTRRHVLTWPRPLDLEVMNAAAEPLLGLTDFASFCKQREGATTIRTLLELSWSRDPAGVAPGTAECRVVADAFCHHMVRSLVGCLLAVGEGRRPVGWPAEILAAQVRDPSVAVAPAHGLTLEEVGYPPAGELADQSERAQARRSLP